MLYLSFLFSCDTDPTNPKVGTTVIPAPASDANIYVERLGQPVTWLGDERLAQFNRGLTVIEQTFFSNTGLGPTFNADACASCHQAPFSGGSAPRYRDLWLIKSERWDGALVNAGTNGESPVRNLYSTDSLHIPEAEDIALYARRNTPSGFGVGLFAFISDDTILALADPEDSNGDGISGEVNFEQGLVGRFGYKSQAASLESFNRGAFFNQMGITTDPIFYTFPESPLGTGDSRGLMDWILSSAHAQVSAPDEPTVDDDGIPDPELSNEDQIDLLIYSTYLGVLPPKSEFDDYETDGAQVFEDIGCTNCHIPTIDSTIGPLRAYTDLLIHDMGEELDDGLEVGFASGSEFRTQPLWNVILHRPYLHDGRANTLDEAIEWHGGEGEDSKQQWLALNSYDQLALKRFLYALGGEEPARQTLATSAPPKAGVLGGPIEGLDESEMALFVQGYKIFDENHRREEGLNDHFNADSCRACHRDPVMGGAGGIDVNVIRYGYRDPSTGEYSSLESSILFRSSYWDILPNLLPEEANVLEGRNPPSILGLGLLNALKDSTILDNEDPNDSNGDGISGRARILDDGRVGRFGWKSVIPSLGDFVADAALNELGLTLPIELSDFSAEADTDDVPDPEKDSRYYYSIEFYLSNLVAPQVQSPRAEGDVELGEALFYTLECSSCHLPNLGDVHAYTDLLLHDIAPDAMMLIEEDPGVMATEYRTAPLWGVWDTPPYLHDGSAPTLSLAISEGHFGEATNSRLAFLELSPEEQQNLIAFLSTL